MKKLLSLLLLLCSFAGFAQEKGKDSFIGMHKKTLLEKYGEPVGIVPDGKKGKILIYTTVQIATVDSNDILGQPQRHIFWVDKRGKVYKWKKGSIDSEGDDTRNLK